MCSYSLKLNKTGKFLRVGGALVFMHVCEVRGHGFLAHWGTLSERNGDRAG